MDDMKVTPLDLPGVLMIEPDVHEDARGYFVESWAQERYARSGIGAHGFVQDNFALSSFNVLRGMHVQWPRPQGKLISVWQGAAWSAVVDIRRSSPNFGKWCSLRLAASNHRQLWVPPGFAHGSLAIAPNTLLHYKVTEPYIPTNAIAFRWDDPEVGITWPNNSVELSARDATAPLLRELLIFT